MYSQYSKDLKRKICNDICINKKSTIRTAEAYGIPLKTVEKWITAFNKDNHCFDDTTSNSNDFQIIKPKNNLDFYDELSEEELKQQLLKKDIEIARLKKGYLVKGGGMEPKEVIIFSKKNTK